MGTSSSSSSSSSASSRRPSEKLKITNHFKLPSPVPIFPSGEGFAKREIDLGGLIVSQISNFKQVWAMYEGGEDNLGATFFEPLSIPEGYFMLGSYGQSNVHPIFGWILVAKDSQDEKYLTEPVDYNLVWSSDNLKIKQDGFGYFWLPIAPDNYKALGLVVTPTSEKPSLEKVRCVRIDFTEQCEHDRWIWGHGRALDSNGFNFFSLRPLIRNTKALGVPVGTFVIQNGPQTNPLPIHCLKNLSLSFSYPMPNLPQIQTLLDAYAPIIYSHPGEKFHPSSVKWFFENGALLYKSGEEFEPVKIDPTGSNLPQGGCNDGTYWLDLPKDKKVRDVVKKGNLLTSEAYIHFKAMLGATFTDIAIWIFYPFNGPARAKVGIFNIPLGKIGQHVGDWEHMSLRISNFDGSLRKVYMSQHSKGNSRTLIFCLDREKFKIEKKWILKVHGSTWIDSSELEYYNGTNKPVAYASLNGHAIYPKPGLVLQGNKFIGIRNDTSKSDKIMDIGLRYNIVSNVYLCDHVIEPAWLNYFRKWGPNVRYDLDKEVKKIGKLLPGKIKTAFEKFVKSLPSEVLGEDGPTGPKVKSSWDGDES